MRILLFLSLVLILPDVFGQLAVLNNGVVQREIDLSGGHIAGKSYTLQPSGTNFIRTGAQEFSLMVNDVTYSGTSNWVDIRSRDTTTANGGKGMILSFRDPARSMALELTYMTYPQLPVVRKFLTVMNTGKTDIKIEAVNVEDLPLNQAQIDAWVLRQYARYKWLGAYVGNWDDPLIVIHDLRSNRGMAVGNEAIGVMKRTSVFVDNISMTAGMTHPEQDYPFRRWLRPGERWTSPGIFTALYNNCTDPQHVVNTSVQDFVRKYADMRIEQIEQKPVFVYNTWRPFEREMDETMIRELAKAAAECGVKEFVIDDGWQLNVHSPEGKPEYHGDWEVDKKKFPNGLKPVFDYIKSLGMKPGLWVSVATADSSSVVFKDHPEWFVKDIDGRIANLHNERPRRTACLGTDWYDYIKNAMLRLVRDYGLAYVKLDFSIVTSAYHYDVARSGCYAEDHPHHRDRPESLDMIYNRCMALFDELHQEAPDLFIDCTFETAGRMQMMDYGIARHAEGNWLSNIHEPMPVGSLRVRNLAWGRSPALPATSLVIGNLLMDEKHHELGFKSLTGSLPIMLGDPRKLSPAERSRYKSWADWLNSLEARHAYMSFRQDLPGFGEPTDGAWDGFCRINTDSGSGGLVGVFKQGAREKTRMVTVPYLKPDKIYQVKQGFGGKIIATVQGKELAEDGFLVTLNELHDGELFEIVLKED